MLKIKVGNKKILKGQMVSLSSSGTLKAANRDDKPMGIAASDMTSGSIAINYEGNFWSEYRKEVQIEKP